MKKVEQLRDQLYSYSFYPVKDVRMKTIFRQYSNLAYDEGIGKPMLTYIYDVFDWKKQVYNKETKAYHYIYPQKKEADLIKMIFTKFFIRLSELSDKVDHPYINLLNSSSLSRKQRKIKQEFQRRIKARNISCLIEQETEKQLKQLIRIEFEGQKEDIKMLIKHYLQRQFGPYLDHMDKANERITKYDSEKYLVPKIKTEVDKKVEKWFAKLKLELIKKIIQR